MHRDFNLVRIFAGKGGHLVPKWPRHGGTSFKQNVLTERTVLGMPKANLAFKERDVRRAIRAVTKEGIAVGRVAFDRDGSFVVITKPINNDGEDDPIATTNEQQLKDLI